MHERAPGLNTLDLAMAGVQGLAAATITFPLAAWTAEAAGPVLGGWPLTQDLLAFQLSAAALAATSLLCALRASGRRPAPRRRLEEADRSLLIAVAVLLGLSGGLTLTSATSAPPAAALCLLIAPAVAAGSAAGGLLWRRDLLGGAMLGWAASLLGLVGALGAAALGGALQIMLAPGLGEGTAQAAAASATLAGSFAACYLGAQTVSALDPLIGQSLLERSGNPG